MNETTITIRGRLTADPELRFTPSGAAVTNLTIASNARRFDKQTNEWKDGPTTFWRCSIWRDAAENVAESLTKGDAVVAVGTIESREWESKEGEKRTALDVNLDGIGPDLRWATAKVTRAQRGPGTGLSQTNSAQTDPWATQPATTAQAPAWGGASDEPPF